MLNTVTVKDFHSQILTGVVERFDFLLKVLTFLREISLGQ